MRKDVLIVGGGAAGLMAALFAARGGAKVTLLERNEKLGKKIYITGKGRCNLTNACEQEEFMRHILRNPRFLYAALAALDNFGTMELMESLGLPLKTERGERVFPASDKASDVTGTLARELARLGVTVRLNARVSRLLTEGGRAAGVLLENGEAVRADAVILATGGFSYPSTGSIGDGHRMAEETGHAPHQCPARPRSHRNGGDVALRAFRAFPAQRQALCLRKGRKKGKAHLCRAGRAAFYPLRHFRAAGLDAFQPAAGGSFPRAAGHRPEAGAGRRHAGRAHGARSARTLPQAAHHRDGRPRAAQPGADAFGTGGHLPRPARQRPDARAARGAAGAFQGAAAHAAEAARLFRGHRHPRRRERARGERLDHGVKTPAGAVLCRGAARRGRHHWRLQFADRLFHRRLAGRSAAKEAEA